METNTMQVELPISEAARLLSQAVVHKSRSAKMADCHELRDDGRIYGIVMVFEKYYLGAGSRLSLTATLDEVGGATRVHWVVSGGSGIFGSNGESKVAAEKFSKAVQEALLSALL